MKRSLLILPALILASAFVALKKEKPVLYIIGDSTVWVARTAETANPDDGLPLENGSVLSTDGPLYASVEAGDPDGELRILLPG